MNNNKPQMVSFDELPDVIRQRVLIDTAQGRSAWLASEIVAMFADANLKLPIYRLNYITHSRRLRPNVDASGNRWFSVPDLMVFSAYCLDPPPRGRPKKDRNREAAAV